MRSRSIRVVWISIISASVAEGRREGGGCIRRVGVGEVGSRDFIAGLSICHIYSLQHSNTAQLLYC